MLLTPKQPDPATSILLLSTTVTINMTLSQISSQIQCSPLNIYQLNIPLQAELLHPFNIFNFVYQCKSSYEFVHFYFLKPNSITLTHRLHCNNV